MKVLAVCDDELARQPAPLGWTTGTGAGRTTTSAYDLVSRREMK